MTEVVTPPAKRTYTKRDKSHFDERDLFPTRKNKGKGCAECGSPSKHKKICSKAGRTSKQLTSASPAPARQTPKRISQMTFGRVKISQSHGIDAETVARNMDLDSADVEKAFDYETYSEYMAA